MLAHLAKTILEFGFRHFRLVVAMVSGASLWACAVWTLWLMRGLEPPPVVLLALPLVQVATATGMRLERSPGRWVRRRALRPIVQHAARVWVACSFAAAFATAALCLTAAAWATAGTLVGALTVQADALVPATPVAVPGRVLDPLFRAIATAAMAAAGCAIGYGYTIGQRRVVITRLEVPLRNLPAALRGFRIVHVSDIHVGAYLPLVRLAQYVDRINALDPDIVCITGDIVDNRLRDLSPALPVLARLRARHGVLAILGNHDSNVGADAVAAGIERATSFRLLRDQRHTLVLPGGRLHVLGIEDRGGAVDRAADEEDRVRALLAGTPRSEPAILLAHRPDVFEAVAPNVGLTLSGHTHGGQIALGLGRGRVLGFAKLVSRFTRGLFERDGSYLYVTHGLGVVGQPVRVGSLREIAVLELVPETARRRSAA
jgi:hypothetical protein